MGLKGTDRSLKILKCGICDIEGQMPKLFRSHFLAQKLEILKFSRQNFDEI